jgi:hypothetical protein
MDRLVDMRFSSSTLLLAALWFGVDISFMIDVHSFGRDLLPIVTLLFELRDAYNSVGDPTTLRRPERHETSQRQTRPLRQLSDITGCAEPSSCAVKPCQDLRRDAVVGALFWSLLTCGFARRSLVFVGLTCEATKQGMIA